MDRKHGWWALAGFALASCLLLLASYVAAYYMLVSTLHAPPRLTADGLRVSLSPTYSAGGSFSQSLFIPMHQLDRRLRPARWEQVINRR